MTSTRYIKEILDYKTKSVYIIYYSYGCKYCDEAITILQKSNIPHVKYYVDPLDFGDLLSSFRQKKFVDATRFDINHKTKPVIFYKGRFIGGYLELKKKLIKK